MHTVKTNSSSLVEKKSLKSTSTILCCPRRFLVIFLITSGFFLMYTLRVNMSIAIVAMTSPKINYSVNNTEIIHPAEFPWDNKIQGIILSSFYYGYTASVLLGGILCKKFGAKFVYGSAMFASSLLNLISPWIAQFNVTLLIICRVLIGIFEGLGHSAPFGMFSTWIPLEEKSRVVSLSFSANYFGTVFSMMFFGYLADISGWRSIFWFAGSVGLVWTFFWWKFMENRPEDDPKISAEELDYIQSSLKQIPSNNRKNPAIIIPWKQILTSGAVWSYIFVGFCEYWGYLSMVLLLPKYFKDIYNVDLTQSGLLSSLPFICLCIMMNIVGYLTDYLINKKGYSVNLVKKTMLVIGFSGPAIFLILAVFLNSITGNVICFIIAVGINAFDITVQSSNALDIAPNYSTIIFAFSLTAGSITGMFAPTVAGFLISTEDPTIQEWRMVFYITAILNLLGLTIFSIFGSVVPQKWDKPNNIADENEESFK